MTRLLLALVACSTAACGPTVATVRGPVAPSWEVRRWVAVANATVLQVELRATLDDLEGFTAPLRRVEREPGGRELQYLALDRVEFARTEVAVTEIERHREPFGGGLDS